MVKRPRPDVPHLDHHLPTSAYPSGHTAATTCLYVALAILVIGHARGWWRWLFLIPAICMPALVALSRMYRGEHHPTDVLGSLLFAALWITTLTLLIKPNEHDRERQPHGTGLRCRARAPSTGLPAGPGPARRYHRADPGGALLSGRGCARLPDGRLLACTVMAAWPGPRGFTRARGHGFRARTWRKCGMIRVSATSGWSAAIRSSAHGSVTASTARPASSTASSHPVKVRRA